VPAGFAGSTAHPAKWIAAASRLIFAFTVLAIAAMLVSAAIGFSLARQSDERLIAEQHAALRTAVAEFRSPVGPSGKIEPRLVPYRGADRRGEKPEIRD